MSYAEVRKSWARRCLLSDFLTCLPTSNISSPQLVYLVHARLRPSSVNTMRRVIRRRVPSRETNKQRWRPILSMQNTSSVKSWPDTRWELFTKAILVKLPGTHANTQRFPCRQFCCTCYFNVLRQALAAVNVYTVIRISLSWFSFNAKHAGLCVERMDNSRVFINHTTHTCRGVPK